MPFATQTDVAIGTRAAQIESVEDDAIKTRYPNRARDGLLQPDAGYFDLVADAQTVLAAREALTGTDGRRRFAVEVEGLIWFDAQAFAGVRLVDSDLSVDAVFLVARIEVDLEAEMTRFELFG